MIVVLAIPLQIPFVLYVPWDNRNWTYITFLPIAFLDFAVVYGAFKLGETIVKRLDARR